ncbi:MAG TPA: hypothetical protein DCM86_08315 [Verrucomicrobiales bacterium]|nr:hypothetical protein [Verrucomicrobiales bacterium]
MLAVGLWLGGWGLSDARGDSVLEGLVPLPKSHTLPVMNQRYEIVARGGVLAPRPPVAILYLEGAFTNPPPPVVQRVLQKEYMFLPGLLPVQVGTRVEFPNLDPTYHNVFSYSSPKRFDLGRYRPEDRPVPYQVFEKPGLVTLRCDIHEHMRGLILVVETPYFALSDTEGRFHLPGLPPGRHTLKAWLDSRTTLQVPVTVIAGTTNRVVFQ